MWMLKEQNFYSTLMQEDEFTLFFLGRIGWLPKEPHFLFARFFKREKVLAQAKTVVRSKYEGQTLHFQQFVPGLLNHSSKKKHSPFYCNSFSFYMY